MESDAAPATPPTVTVEDLRDSVLRQAREVCALKEQFFADEAERIATCCQAMAQSFDQGGRLWAMGNGGSCADAAHMAVECMHPIIEKRPALPALSLTNDMATLTAIGNDADFSMAFVEQLQVLGRAGDIAMGFSTSGKSANINRAMRTAREMGMLTVGLAGKDGGRMIDACDHCFVVPSFSIPRIQETHETLLHLIWDMIHVFRGEEDVF